MDECQDIIADRLYLIIKAFAMLAEIEGTNENYTIFYKQFAKEP